MNNCQNSASTSTGGSASPELTASNEALDRINLKDVQRRIEPAMKGRRLDLAGGGWEMLVLSAVEEAMMVQPQRSIRPQVLKECLRKAYEEVNTMPEIMALKIREGDKEKFATIGESWLLRAGAKRSLSSVIDRACVKCLEHGFLALLGGYLEITTAGRTVLTAAGLSEPSSDSIEPVAVPVPKQDGGREKVSGEACTLEKSKAILQGYHDILAVLHIKYSKEACERVKYANRTHYGPIRVGKRGEKPRADRELLIKWWNSLVDKIEVAAVTSETTIEIPTSEVLWDGSKRIGHVKGSQRPTGHLARHDATSRNISKRQ